LPTDRFLIPGTRTNFGDGDVSKMTSPGLESFKALLQAAAARRCEIHAEMAVARWQLFGAKAIRAAVWVTLLPALIPAIRKSSERGVALRIGELANLEENLASTPIKVDFDLDSEVGEPHRRMQRAFDRLGCCAAIWTMKSSQQIDRVRARSAAGSVVDRTKASIGRAADALVATSEAPPAIAVQGGRAVAYLYPGFVLVAQRDGTDFALVDLTDIDVRFYEQQFVESDAVPGDAQVVGKAWAKSNKDGSRDRRFAHNREIPVALYGNLDLTSPGGLHESLMASQPAACAEFAAAVTALKRILASGKTAQKIGERKTIGSRR
jgi:hypothetical protein